MRPEAHMLVSTINDPILSLSSEIERAYPDINGKILGIQFLTSSENRTYRIHGEDGDYAMRVQRSGYHDEEEINAELAFLDILINHGLTVAKPLRRHDGAFVSHFLTKEGEQLVTIFHWVQGRHPEESDFADVYGKMGSVMGRMHNVSQKISRDFNHKRPHWTLKEMIGVQATWGDWYHPNHIEPDQQRLVQEFLQDFRKRLHNYDDSTRRGLIHADMRPTNVLVNGDDLIVIDFDDCCHSWYLYDIAATVSFLEHRQGVTQWMTEFITQYQKESLLSKDELKLLPYFVGLRRVQLMAWYFSHQESDYCQSLESTWLHESFTVLEKVMTSQLTFI